MFEHFTFGVPSRLDHEVYDVSPCDTSCQPARPPSSSSSPPASPESDQVAAPSALSDLLSKLEDSQLRGGNDDFYSPSYFYGIPSPPPDAESEVPLEIDPHYDSKSAIVTPQTSRPPSALRCRRLQRQLNAQLLCTQPQIQSINALVDEMLASGSQCNVHEAPLSPAVPSMSAVASPPIIEADSPGPGSNQDEDFDEGFFDADPADEVEFSVENLMMRVRSGAHGPTGVLKYTSSSRMRGPRDVLNKPRMRKRISVRKSD